MFLAWPVVVEVIYEPLNPNWYLLSRWFEKYSKDVSFVFTLFNHLHILEITAPCLQFSVAKCRKRVLIINIKAQPPGTTHIQYKIEKKLDIPCIWFGTNYQKLKLWLFSNVNRSNSQNPERSSYFVCDICQSDWKLSFQYIWLNIFCT